MASSATSPENPGNVLASAVDAEIAKFRQVQAELQGLRTDLQVVLGQQTENEMVQQELELVGDSNSVYKMIGPVLIKQELDDAQQTVKKRLEFISGEKEKIEKKIKDKEKQATELAAKVQQMQAQLQQMTSQAVQAIAEQHKAR